MFRKNDSFLFKAKTVILVIAVAMGVLVVITSILAFASGQMGTGIVTLISGAIGIALYLLLAFLLLSVAVDIKYIRNKLYNHNDEMLNTFWGEYDGPYANKDINSYKPVGNGGDDKYKKLAELNVALKTGRMTQEEYDARKKEILGE